MTVDNRLMSNVAFLYHSRQITQRDDDSDMLFVVTHNNMSTGTGNAIVVGDKLTCSPNYAFTKDKHPGSTYWVIKLTDGRCFLSRVLEYDPDNETLLCEVSRLEPNVSIAKSDISETYTVENLHRQLAKAASY